jgi:hypothetical protein
MNFLKGKIVGDIWVWRLNLDLGLADFMYFWHFLYFAEILGKATEFVLILFSYESKLLINHDEPMFKC